MSHDQLAAYAEERLGMSVQAITLARPCPPGQGPEVWEVMTELGYFWLVEQDGATELFRAGLLLGRQARHLSCNSPAAAARLFKELHPDRRRPRIGDSGRKRSEATVKAIASP
jgi:hypothetical protein